MAVPLSPKYLAGKRAYTNFRDTIPVCLCVREQHADDACDVRGGYLVLNREEKGLLSRER